MFLDLRRIREHQEGIASALDSVVELLDTCLGHSIIRSSGFGGKCAIR
jgi:hypothetical protein